MTADLRELLPLYALGALDADEAAAVERAVAADPALAAELASYRDAADRLVDLVPAVAPPPDVKARLLASVGAGPFERFAARIASIYDVTVDRAREVLGLIERTASWDSPFPGIPVRGVHFQGGPACAAADCGLLRLPAGCTFPWHTHRGEELTFILAGALRDQDGHVFRAGDEQLMPAGSRHVITCVGPDDVIFAARVFAGIDLSTGS